MYFNGQWLSPELVLSIAFLAAALGVAIAAIFLTVSQKAPRDWRARGIVGREKRAKPRKKGRGHRRELPGS